MVELTSVDPAVDDFPVETSAPSEKSAPETISTPSKDKLDETINISEENSEHH